MSGERAALLSSIIYMFLIVLLLRKFYYEKIIIVFSLLSFIFIIFTYHPHLKDKIVNKTLNELNINQNILLINKSYAGFYQTSFNIFANNPIFGEGPKTFREKCKNYNIKNNCSTHPHNYYLQLMSEAGIIGSLPLIILFCYISYLLINLFITRKTNSDLSMNVQASYLSIIFVNFLPFIPSGSFFNNWLNILLYLPLIFLSFEKIYNKRLNSYLIK